MSNQNFFSQTELVEWKKNGIIDGFQEECLDISNIKGWKNNSLTITNCPKLRIIRIRGCSLHKLTIDSSPKELNTLDIGNNYLTKFETKKNWKNLEKFYLDNNSIFELDVRKFKKLKVLHCFVNGIKDLDCRDMEDLEELIYSNNRKQMNLNYSGNTLDVNGCNKLKIIDAAENYFKKLVFPFLPELENLSLRENGLLQDEEEETYSLIREREETLVLNTPKLKQLDYAYSDIKEVKYLCETPFLKPESICSTPWKDEYNKTGEYEENPDFEQHAYEYRKRMEQEDIESGKGIYEGMTDLDFSQKDYGSFIINGNCYPKSITSINLGDNFITYLKISNFPNLQRVIISHNKLEPKNFFIENCPKFDLSLFYHYKSNDEAREAPPTREYNEETDNPFKQKEKEQKRQKKSQDKLNQQVKTLLTKIEKGENNAFQEFINSFQGQDFKSIFNGLNEDCQEQFKKTFVPKLEEYVKKLINNYSQMNKDEFAEKVNEILPFKTNLTVELRNKLVNLLKSLQQERQVTQPTINYWPFYLVFIVAFLRIGSLLFKREREREQKGQSPCLKGQRKQIF